MSTRRVLADLYRSGRTIAAAGIARSGPAERSVRRAAGLVDAFFLGRLVRPSELPNPVVFRGYRFWHGGEPSWTVLGAHLGTYEQDTVRVVEDILTEGMCLVDVGAHIGLYSVIGAAAVGRTGRVYAFEASPRNAELLRRNLSENGCDGRVRVVEAAVYSEAAQLPLYTDMDDTGSYSIYPGRAHGAAAASVPALALDDFFAAEGWPRVDLIKVDIEGAERSALAGMHELLRRNPQARLVIEFALETLHAAGVVPAEFIAALSDAGLTRVYAIGGRLRAVDGDAGLRWLEREAGSRVINLLCSGDTK